MNGLTADFDGALNTLRDTKGLVLDLRETPNRGDTVVARAIIRRFITREQPYQRHELTAEERETGIRRSWLQLVSPRASTYRQLLFVLAERWTGSMGEGLTIGSTLVFYVLNARAINGLSEQVAARWRGLG